MASGRSERERGHNDKERERGRERGGAGVEENRVMRALEKERDRESRCGGEKSSEMCKKRGMRDERR